MTPAWLEQLVGAEGAQAAAAVTSCAPLAEALRRRSVDPLLVDERQLAVAVAGEELWAPLYGWRLTVVGCWTWGAWGPGARSAGAGWLMDAGARRILAGEASAGAELWVGDDAHDWLRLATHWSEDAEAERGAIGLVRMPWPLQLARLIPEGCTVVVASEQVGHRVLRTLRGRGDVSLRLWQPRVA